MRLVCGSSVGEKSTSKKLGDSGQNTRSLIESLPQSFLLRKALIGNNEAERVKNSGIFG